MYVSMRKTFILLLSLTVLLPVTALAGPGRTGAQILNLGGGARARALGDAFSAMSRRCNGIPLEPKRTRRYAGKQTPIR